jgi:hypothetical protein
MWPARLLGFVTGNQPDPSAGAVDSDAVAPSPEDVAAPPVLVPPPVPSGAATIARVDPSIASPETLGIDGGSNVPPPARAAFIGASDVHPVASASSTDRDDPPSAAPTGYDVSDDAVLARLRSGDASDQVMASEIVRARRGYPKVLADGKLYLSRSDSNGGKPVLTLVPNAVVNDPTQPFNTVVHYHGMVSTATSPNPAAGADTKIDRQMNGDPLTVFVLPEAQNGDRGWTDGFYPDWSNVKNCRATADDALAAAGLGPTGAGGILTVSAHSAGGRALAVLAHRAGLSCDRLQMEDCLYGVAGNRRPDSFAASCATEVKKWAATDDGKLCTTIIYVRSNGGGNGENASAADYPNQAFSKPLVAQHYDADFFPLG